MYISNLLYILASLLFTLVLSFDNYIYQVTVSIVCYTAQAQFSGCFTNSGCTGPALGPVNAEDCCVNSAGTYFSDGGQCLKCIGIYPIICICSYIATLFLPQFLGKNCIKFFLVAFCWPRSQAVFSTIERWVEKRAWYLLRVSAHVPQITQNLGNRTTKIKLQ